ncbi:MAG: ATP-binding protein [Planctomycetes bacterium]|nr:ATP-binding protein [Planctomycetota bacterium]
MDKEILKYVLSQSAARSLPHAVPRTMELPLDSTKVVTVVGIRRSGKTYLLYETMRRLLAQGVDRRQILYLNFEDDRLFPIRTSDLDLILRAHEELFPQVSGRRKYVFLDEVQNAPSWETFVRRLHDTEEARLFLTGSSSRLLSREIATGLRGRSISYEVFPLSFAEFLAFRNLKSEPFSRTSESRMSAALEEYLEVGGLPEVVLADAELRPRILKEYVDLLFYKDLVERYKVANPRLLRLLLQHCLGHPASLVNVHKLYQDFRSQGHQVSKDSLYRYFDALEESFVVFTLPVAERSVRKQARNPKKLHAIDWALAYPFVAEPGIDVGKKLETAVFLHWRRRREDLAYLAGDHEIDLVVNRDRPAQLVNVAWSVTRTETWDREIAALQWARARFPRVPRVLVAHERTTRKPPAGVRVVDAWQYLLTLSRSTRERSGRN